MSILTVILIAIIIVLAGSIVNLMLHYRNQHKFNGNNPEYVAAWQVAMTRIEGSSILCYLPDGTQCTVEEFREHMRQRNDGLPESLGEGPYTVEPYEGE